MELALAGMGAVEQVAAPPPGMASEEKVIFAADVVVVWCVVGGEREFLPLPKNMLPSYAP